MYFIFNFQSIFEYELNTYEMIIPVLVQQKCKPKTNTWFNNYQYRIKLEKWSTVAFTLFQFGFRRSHANVIISLRMFMELRKVVSCQLRRLRLLPTTQTMKAAGNGDRITILTPLVLPPKAALMSPSDTLYGTLK